MGQGRAGEQADISVYTEADKWIRFKHTDDGGSGIQIGIKRAE